MTGDEDRDRRIVAYLSGEATPEEQASLEAEMTADPALAAEVATMAGVRAALAADAAETGDRERGWDRLSSRIDAERAGGAANDNRAGARRWPVALAQAASVAIAAVLIWEVAISPLVDDRTAVNYAPVSEGGAEAGVAAELVADVVFAPDAPISEISALIRSVDGVVHAGPSAIGVYRIRFETNEARDAALSAFSAAPATVMTATPG